MDLGYFVKLRGEKKSFLYQVSQDMRDDFAVKVSGLANETIAKVGTGDAPETFKVEILTAETVEYVQRLQNLLHDMSVAPNMPLEWVLDIQATLNT